MGLIGTLQIVSCFGDTNTVCRASASQVGLSSNSIRDLPWVMAPVVNGLVCCSVFFEFCYDYYNIENVCIQMYVVFSAKIFQ